jgi:hypothetical protein
VTVSSGRITTVFRYEYGTLFPGTYGTLFGQSVGRATGRPEGIAPERSGQWSIHKLTILFAGTLFDSTTCPQRLCPDRQGIVLD